MKTNGLTIIELTIVITILLVLASVLSLVFGTTLRKAQEGTTMANLANIRIALHLYYSNYNTYPTNYDLRELISEGLLRSIPYRLTPPYHDAGNIVFCVDTPTSDGIATEIMGQWLYSCNEDAPDFGQVQAFCQHMTLKGIPWTAY